MHSDILNNQMNNFVFKMTGRAKLSLTIFPHTLFYSFYTLHVCVPRHVWIDLMKQTRENLGSI